MNATAVVSEDFPRKLWSGLWSGALPKPLVRGNDERYGIRIN
jgi:hypothetical protein